MLEWGGEGKSPVPLLKDMFANERRKAKVLNFSIAYGKTAHGLSKDWKTSLQEAENTVERWYADRPEVCCHILVAPSACNLLLPLYVTAQPACCKVPLAGLSDLGHALLAVNHLKTAMQFARSEQPTCSLLLW